MTPSHTDLAIVVPARNEAEHIVELARQLAAAFPGAEIIVVDNASTDGTADVVKSSNLARVVHESRPGKGHAMRTGVLSTKRPLVLFHDADLEYAPSDALSLVDAVRCDRKAMAVGVRTASFGCPAWSSLLAAGLVRWMLQRRWSRATVGPADVLCGTRALTREAFLALRTRQAGFRIETEITRRALQAGTKLVHHAVAYRPRSRAEGKKIRPAHLWGILVETMLR